MAVATLFSDVMALLTGNSGGNLQQLPAVTINGARKRVVVSTIALASQASGSVIGVARVPLGAVLSDITVITDTSLGSATIALGDANSGAIYAAAQTLTGVNTATRMGNAATQGAPINTGYDCVSGSVSKSNEDIVLTVGVAALPASGTLRLILEWAID